MIWIEICRQISLAVLPNLPSMSSLKEVLYKGFRMNAPGSPFCIIKNYRQSQAMPPQNKMIEVCMKKVWKNPTTTLPWSSVTKLQTCLQNQAKPEWFKGILRIKTRMDMSFQVQSNLKLEHLISMTIIWMTKIKIGMQIPSFSIKKLDSKKKNPLIANKSRKELPIDSIQTPRVIRN